MTPHDWKRIARQKRKDAGAPRVTLNSTYRCKRCLAKVTVDHRSRFQKAGAPNLPVHWISETMEEAMRRRRISEDCDEMVVKQVMEL
jgi:hypothetical protein